MSESEQGAAGAVGDVAAELAAVRRETGERLAAAGDWLTGVQRAEVWDEVRGAAHHPLDIARREALTPAAVDGAHQPTANLSATAVEVVHRLATDSGRLSRSWAELAMGELGEETYTELVGVTAMAAALDRLDLLLDDGLSPRPTSVDGEPRRLRPDGVGDVGAWVSQTVEKQRANVSRALSLVPVTNATWRPLVNLCYSRGDEFSRLRWDRHLNRPQVELVAARTTAHNECFY